MRSLDELTLDDSGWSTLEDWVDGASEAQVLAPPDPCRGEVLHALQVTTRSILGAIAWHTDGVLVELGWLRHLGAGELREWNASLGGAPLDPPLAGALIVAVDAAGGIFAINSGGLPGDAGLVHYFAPDTQAWMALDIGHSAFVEWSLSPDLDQFYMDLRWHAWRSEIAEMDRDEAMTFYPPLGFEAMPLDERSRRPASRREIWSFLNEIARQTAGLPDGTKVGFSVSWDGPARNEDS